ncbi:MAG: collagen triple helix repeat protein, partial [Bacteroidota bacterium]|nr:collagen triple helix repeat protein [Bacteroidota bacterium]
MKKLVSLLAGIVLAHIIYAGVPQAVNYQAIARDANGSIIPNKNLCMRFTIDFGINPGVPEYQETQSVHTNQFGLFTCKIGEGNPTIGSFPGVQWNTFNKYLLVEEDLNCTGVFLNMGSTELVSVPYALYAENA